MTLAAWKKDLWLWVPALILLATSAAGFVAYRALYAGEAEARRARVGQVRREAQQLADERRRAQQMLAQAERNQRNLERLYAEGFQTEEARITKVIAEVKDLAERAGLDPPRIAYPDEAIENYGLLKRSIVFGVDGTYQSLRRFVNFLELTDSFLILEEVRPGEGGGARAGNRLSIDLKISTLFLDEDVEAAALARSRDALRRAR